MRRALLAAALALALAPAGAAAAPQVSQFGMAVPAGAGAAAASGQIVTRPMRAPQRYDMAAAEWRGRAGASVWLRGRRTGGRWGRWTRLDPSEQPLKRGSGTEPAWAGGYDWVQLRSSRPLPGLHLSFVRFARDALAAAAPRTITVQMPPPAGGQLQIVPRAAWGAARCQPRVTAGYGQVDFALVHHTTTLNSYSRAQSAAIVLGICLFHRNVNGWNDIGYNLLVDKYGQVFEGRQGGIDAQVVGAQAGGFNAVSAGFATIGNFSRSRFSDAGMSSLAHAIAWKLSLDGVPAQGQITVTSAGGPFTPFRAGTRVTVNRISGHRNVDSTACPGRALYAQLPGLRQLVAGLEGPVSRLTLAAAAQTLTFPQPAVLSGTLAEPPGLAIPPGASVEIQDRLAAGGRTLTTLPVANGGFVGSLPLAHNDVVRAVYEGGGLPRVVSTPIYVTVLPVLTLQASAPSVAHGSLVTLSGKVAPAKAHVTIVEQVLRRGVFRQARQIKVPTSAGGFTRAITLSRAGSYRFIARSPADRLTGFGQSAAVGVSVG